MQHRMMLSTMAEQQQQLIVDSPTNRRKRSVRFSETSEMCVVPRHEDNDGVRRQDLWYNKADYSRMRLATQRTVLKVREMASAGIPVSYSSFDVCLVGIEHLLTPATLLEVKLCRLRCVGAVLEEQARQMMNPYGTFGWNNTAMASLSETRRAAVRARKLGKLHREAA
jgi:hypothetical protein